MHASSANNRTRELKFSSFDGGDQEEHMYVGVVEIYELFSIGRHYLIEYSRVHESDLSVEGICMVQVTSGVNKLNYWSFKILHQLSICLLPSYI